MNAEKLRVKMNRWMNKQIWMEAWINKGKGDGRTKDTKCLVNEWLNDQMDEYNVNEWMIKYIEWINDQMNEMKIYWRNERGKNEKKKDITRMSCQSRNFGKARKNKENKYWQIFHFGLILTKLGFM